MSASNLYNPDQAAVDTRWIEPWSVRFRTQRDVELQVPINFHTMPAVSLHQACFVHRQYEHLAFQKCFSNLLAVGFTRFSVDVYWDSLRKQWSLCPVQLPPSDSSSSGGGGSSREEAVVMVAGRMVIPNTTAAYDIPGPTGKMLGSDVVFEHRQNSQRLTKNFARSQASSSSSPPSIPTVTSYPLVNSPPLIQVGSYNCTSLTTLNLLTGVLADFLDSTATTVGAAVSIFTLNVHAASSLRAPDEPAAQLSPDQTPLSGMLLSDLLKGNLSNVLYTPSLLQDQRANLNRSWYDDDLLDLPVQGYYNLSKPPSGPSFTQDGWPSEYFVEFQQMHRVAFGFDSVDPQMKNYNSSLDAAFIFPPRSLTTFTETTIGTDGQIASGCLFDASDMSPSPRTNSSWAISTITRLDVGASPVLEQPISQVANFTSCGLTAYLNQSLADATADQNPLPYAAYVHSVLWSWAPGEPLNTSSGAADTTVKRCVLMSASPPYPGRWRVADCKERHHVACRHPAQPYHWELSSADSDYAGASSVCRSPLQFGVPHTGLENAHLLAALQSQNHMSSIDQAIFIDLNSLTVPDCWITGINGSCPYLLSSDQNHSRIVIIPTVAAVIVLVLAVLTFFVKCAANRRENLRGMRRRMVGGWEYEGVPS